MRLAEAQSEFPRISQKLSDFKRSPSKKALLVLNVSLGITRQQLAALHACLQNRAARNRTQLQKLADQKTSHINTIDSVKTAVSAKKFERKHSILHEKFVTSLEVDSELQTELQLYDRRLQALAVLERHTVDLVDVFKLESQKVVN